MKRIQRILLNTGLIISLCFGVWHFFIPYMYKWYDYLPDAPREIIVSIDWINFFFSLLLTGISVLLIVNQKMLICRNKAVYSFYSLLILTWFSRVMITLIHPWHINYIAIDIIQISAFIFELILLLIPYLFYLLRRTESEMNAGILR